MSSRTIILTLTFIAAAVPAFGQYRPIPDQTQQYYRQHTNGPGISTPSTQFIHAPVLNDPMCSECQTPPIQYLKEEYDAHLSPHVWGPAVLQGIRTAPQWAPRALIHAENKVIETTPRLLVGLENDIIRGANGTARALGITGFYGSAEVMRWSTNSPSVQPLITTSVAGTAQGDAGVLGQPGTSVLFGGELFEDTRNGGRYTGGIVFQGAQRFMLEAIYTRIGTDSLAFRADGDATSIVARPFFNSTISEEDSRLVAFPGFVDGRVDITGSSKFDTLQIALRRSAGRVFGLNTDYTIGYREADLSDTLRILDISNSLSGGTAGARFEVRDEFRTENSFDGIEFGLISRLQPNNRFFVDVLGKVALGRSSQQVTVDGRTITRPAGGDRTGVDGGLLTQPTNIGRFNDSGFAAIFEFGTTLRYRFNSNVQGLLGYTFLAWSDVARAANQLDDTVNTTQFDGGALVGDPRPLFRMDTGQFTAHGLRLGVQISF